jgi:hypothetical protein
MVSKLRKEIIITVTTGRSGTKFLSRILSFINDIKSEHEADPAFHEVFRQYEDNNLDFEQFWRDKKIPYINQLPERLYSDVSHVGCKGFIEPLLKMGLRPKFIFLKRKNRDVAISLFKLKTIPLRTEAGLKYLNSPLDKNVLRVIGGVDDLTDYQLCYWYTLEIDRRIDKYKRIASEKSLEFISIDFNELVNNPFVLYKIQRELKLPKVSIFSSIKYLLERRKIVNSKINSKSNLVEVDYEIEEGLLLNRIKWE